MRYRIEPLRQQMIDCGVIRPPSPAVEALLLAGLDVSPPCRLPDRPPVLRLDDAGRASAAYEVANPPWKRRSPPVNTDVAELCATMGERAAARRMALRSAA